MFQKESVSSLPSPLLISFLKKLETKQLLRMRRTCSLMNSVVEDNHKTFASRPHVGIELVILLNGATSKIEILGGPSHGEPVHPIDKCEAYYSGLEKKFSGVSFHDIRLFGCDESMPVIEGKMNHALVDILKHLKPICLCLFLNNVTFGSIAPVTDEIEVIGEDGINILPKRENTETDVFFATLARAKNCSKFHLVRNEYFIDQGLFDVVRPFLKVFITTMANGLQNLLWDIYNFQETISMKSLHIDLYSIGLGDTGSFPYTKANVPPFQTLGMPSNAKKYNLRGIYSISLSTQFVVIFERVTEFSDVTLHFVKKSHEGVLTALYRWRVPRDAKEKEEYCSIASSIFLSEL